MHLWLIQFQFCLLFNREPSKQLIEDMKVPLPLAVGHNTGFLQEVLFEACSQHHSLSTERELEELAKTGAIVVHHSLGIAKRFQNRSYLHTYAHTTFQYVRTGVHNYEDVHMCILECIIIIYTYVCIYR